jgi:hypothetical protein
MQHTDFHINEDDGPDAFRVNVSRARSGAYTPQTRDFQTLAIMMIGVGEPLVVADQRDRSNMK